MKITLTLPLIRKMSNDPFFLFCPSDKNYQVQVKLYGEMSTFHTVGENKVMKAFWKAKVGLLSDCSLIDNLVTI